MNALKLTAIALILAGALALAYGSFSFTKETHAARMGPITMSMHEEQTVNVPVWAGAAIIALGAGLLIFGGRRG